MLPVLHSERFSYLSHIYWLFLDLIHMIIYSLCASPWQAQVHQKRISTENHVVFLILEVLPFHLFREVNPFIIWFYPPYLDYDVFVHNIEDLVLVIPTSPSSQKSESGCSSYGRFGFSSFCSLQGRRLRPGGPETPAEKGVFSVFELCFCPESPGGGDSGLGGRRLRL